MIMKCFPDDLHFDDAGLYGNIRKFILTSSFRYISSLGVIEVPAGFITDGASIPSVFWPFLSPFGEYFKAAIIHDYLYSKDNTLYDRRTSDLIFKEAMFNLGVCWARRDTIFRAVRIFGASSFHGFLR